MTPEELLKQKTLLDTQIRSYEIEAEQTWNTFRIIRSWGSIAREDDPQNEARSKIVAQFSRGIIETIAKLDVFKGQLMDRYISGRNISGKDRTTVDQLINIAKFFTRASHVEVSLQSFCRELQNIASSSNQSVAGSFFPLPRRHTVPGCFPREPEGRGRCYSTGSVPKPR